MIGIPTSLISNIGITFFAFILLILGKYEIVNRLRYMLLKGRGYTYFAFMTPSGKVEEAVLKIDKQIKYKGGTYIYDPRFQYKYDLGGNFFVEGIPNAIKISSIYKAGEDLKFGLDSKSLTAILKRVYNLGKLSNTGMPQKFDRMTLYMILGGIALILYVTAKNSGMI